MFLVSTLAGRCWNNYNSVANTKGMACLRHAPGWETMDRNYITLVLLALQSPQEQEVKSSHRSLGGSDRWLEVIWWMNLRERRVNESWFDGSVATCWDQVARSLRTQFSCIEIFPHRTWPRNWKAIVHTAHSSEILVSFSHKNPTPVSHITYKQKNPEKSEIVQPCQFHNRSWYMEDRNTFLVAHSTDHLCWPAISFDSFAWANDLKITHRTWTLPRGDLPLESKCYWDIESRRHSVSRRSRA